MISIRLTLCDAPTRSAIVRRSANRSDSRLACHQLRSHRAHGVVVSHPRRAEIRAPSLFLAAASISCLSHRPRGIVILLARGLPPRAAVARSFGRAGPPQRPPRPLASRRPSPPPPTLCFAPCDEAVFPFSGHDGRRAQLRSRRRSGCRGNASLFAAGWFRQRPPTPQALRDARSPSPFILASARALPSAVPRFISKSLPINSWFGPKGNYSNIANTSTNRLTQ